jgi:hypothetical protein
MQVAQRIRRDLRSPERHDGAHPGVEHPRRKRCYDARFDLDVYDAAASALLAILSSHTSAVEGMPRVMNYNFLPDMGRMTA